MKYCFACLSMLCCWVMALPIMAQRNEVIYNLFNDSVTYKRDGQPVKALRLRKGDEIRLHLTEFNPFTSDLQLDVEEINDYTPLVVTGMAGLDGLIPGLPGDGMGGGDIPGSGGVGNDVPILDIPAVVVGTDTIDLKKMLGISRGGEDALQAVQMMKEISALLVEIGQLHQSLLGIERAAAVSRIALVNVQPLRQHPNIRPSLVQQMCREYYDVVFQKSPGEPLSLNDLLAWQEIPAKFELTQQRLRSKHGELTAKIGVLEGISRTIANNQAGRSEAQQFVREMIDLQVKSKAVRDQLKDFTAKSVSLGSLPTIQEMADLQIQLAEVISNDFTYHATLQPEADQLHLHIKLQRKSADGEEPQTVKERNLHLEVRGGMRVHASAGLSFGQFFEPGQNYSVSNGVIVGEDEGVFTPSLTSFLHFHGYRGRRATVGGTFGLGFPLLSASDGQIVEFFLGPSFMLGAKQKLIISTGIKGGRVQRLTKGYQVGDQFDANFGDIPTTGKYALGLFLGTSFNLGN